MHRVTMSETGAVAFPPGWRPEHLVGFLLVLAFLPQMLPEVLVLVLVPTTSTSRLATELVQVHRSALLPGPAHLLPQTRPFCRSRSALLYKRPA